jgi:ABC-type Fe3+-hydroxamate transport system substrate-binding protein
LSVGLLLAVVLVGCSSETSTPEPTTTTTPPPTYTVGPPTVPGVATVSVTVDTADPVVLDEVLRSVAGERSSMDQAWVQFLCLNGDEIGLGKWATTPRARAASGFSADETYRVEVSATSC